MISGAQLSDAKTAELGYVGRIPVRNLWLLMFYASDLFRMRGITGVELEEAPDELPDLVAEILAKAVETRLRRQLTCGYRPRLAIVNRVRGRIDVLATEGRQLVSRGQVACRFDELTIDTPRNRFVRAALEMIARIARQPHVIRRCRKLSRDLMLLGVTAGGPTYREASADRLGRHDRDDQFMIAAAKLAYDLALPTEVSGDNRLPLPDREERWVRLLYERAVGGFYEAALNPEDWFVKRGQKFGWQIEDKSGGIDEILPNMQTDIILEDRRSARRIVIDTKFNSILAKGWHRDETLRSGHIYQIYAYLLSQSGRGDMLADRAEGVLLHPSVFNSLDENVTIQGHRMRFVTVDLTASSYEIRNQLLRVCAPANLCTT